MKTRTKLNIILWVVSLVIWLVVFSDRLHIPDSFQWVLILAQFILLGLLFYYIKQQKREKQRQPAAPEDARLREQQKARKWLIVSMVLGAAMGLCSPFWMPLTGTTLGFRGDLICGVFTTVIVCAILGFRLRKIGRGS